MTEKFPAPKREYPAIYEKIVPIVLGFLAIIVIGILVFTILVGLEIINFS